MTQPSADAAAPRAVAVPRTGGEARGAVVSRGDGRPASRAPTLSGQEDGGSPARGGRRGVSSGAGTRIGEGATTRPLR